MLKLLKWEGINYIKIYGIFYMVFGVIILLGLIFPTNHSYSSFVAIACSFIGGTLFFLGILVLIERVFGWISKKTATLESSISVPTWKFLSSKMIFLIFIQIINFLLVMLLSVILSKFATEDTSFLSLKSFAPISAIFGYIFLINFLTLCDFIARSLTNKNHAFLAICIFIISAIILLYLFGFTLKITGSADVEYYGLSFSVKNENNLIVRYIFFSLVTIGSFLVNCTLLNKKINV